MYTDSSAFSWTSPSGICHLSILFYTFFLLQFIIKYQSINQSKPSNRPFAQFQFDPRIIKKNPKIKFRGKIRDMIQGIEIKYADNVIHHITCTQKAICELEDLKGILQYVEKILKESSINRCETRDNKIVNILDKEIKF